MILMYPCTCLATPIYPPVNVSDEEWLQEIIRFRVCDEHKPETPFIKLREDVYYLGDFQCYSTYIKWKKDGEQPIDANNGQIAQIATGLIRILDDAVKYRKMRELLGIK